MRARRRSPSPRRPQRRLVPTLATSSSRWSRSARVLLALASLLLAASNPARAQPGDELPAVTASPLDREGPNGGQWFALEAERGEAIEVVALVTNPAKVAQTVRLYLADMTFRGDQPAVGDRGVGVGAWGAFVEPEVRVDGDATVRSRFSITVPADAEPGDHIGAVVAESGVTGDAGGVGVIKRVAARLYVTVPGEADASVEIDELEAKLDRAGLPRAVTGSFLVRNTGNVRLDSSVEVNGRAIDGPGAVVSRSAEAYEARIPLSIWGGRRSLDVRVRTTTRAGDGPTARDEASILVLPWWILLAAFLIVVGALAVRELARRLR